jgi:hypothetical protein
MSEIDPSSKIPALNLREGLIIHTLGLVGGPDGEVVDTVVEHALGTSVVFETAAVYMTEVVVRTGILRADPTVDNA